MIHLRWPARCLLRTGLRIDGVGAAPTPYEWSVDPSSRISAARPSLEVAPSVSKQESRTAVVHPRSDESIARLSGKAQRPVDRTGWVSGARVARCCRSVVPVIDTGVRGWTVAAGHSLQR
jgi:hypothetical protein